MICVNCNTHLPDDSVCCFRCAYPTTADFTRTHSSARRVEPIGDETAETVTRVRVPETLSATVLTQSAVPSLKNFFILFLIAVVIVAAIVYAVAALKPFMAVSVAENRSVTPNANQSSIQSTYGEIKRTTTPAPSTRPQRTPKPAPLPVEQTPLPVEQTPENTPQARTLIDDEVSIPAYKIFTKPFILDTPSKVSGTFVAQGGSNDIECFVVGDIDYINLRNGTDFKSYYSSGNVTVGQISLNLVAGSYYLVFRNKAWITNKTVIAKIGIQ